jgi:hypothetical protein
VSWQNARPKLNAYGAEHQRERRRRAKLHSPDHPCTRCAQPLGPMGPQLHLDHDDHDRRRYLGFAHRACNLRAGARKGRAQQTRPEHPTGCRYCGDHTGPGRVYCSQRCGYLGTRGRPPRQPKPPRQRKTKPAPPAQQCRLCGTTYTGRRIYCSSPCLEEYGARSMREAYRARAGLPPTWDQPVVSTCDRWQGPVYHMTHSDGTLSVAEWIKRSKASRET